MIDEKTCVTIAVMPVPIMMKFLHGVIAPRRRERWTYSVETFLKNQPEYAQRIVDYRMLPTQLI